MNLIWDLYEQAASYLRNNQFAGGGLFLGLAGALIAVCRTLPGRFMAWSWRRISVEVEVNSRDELFTAVEYWLSRSGMLKRSRNLLAKFRNAPPSISGASYDHDSTDDEWESNSNARAKAVRDAKAGIELSPGPGRHWLWRNRRLILLDRVSKEKEKASEGRTVESFTFHVLSRNLETARELLAEAILACLPEDQKVTRVYSAPGDYWRVCATYRSRPANSIILPDGVFEKLEADLRKFYSRRDWYRGLGIPYRRGYLLAGKPGNGKTSSIVALAGIFETPICVLDLSSPLMTDERLRELLSDAPQGAFLLFEDIDAVFRDRESTKSQNDPFGLNPIGGMNSSKADRVTLSGLLNALDGVASPEGRIVFMSTNYPERLDSALIRPGRVDLRVDFNNANASQLQRLFLRFFGDDRTKLEPMAQEFAGLLGNGEVSMATAQGLLLESQDDPSLALERAKALHSQIPSQTLQSQTLPPLDRAFMGKTNGVLLSHANTNANGNRAH